MQLLESFYRPLRHGSGLTLLGLGLGGGFQAGAEHLEIYRVNAAPALIVVDGVLDDAAWQAAEPVPVLRERLNGQAPQYSVDAKMLWDTNCLYIGYRVEDPDVWAFQRIDDEPMCAQYRGLASGVTNAAMQSGGWGTYVENYVMFYFDPDGDGRNYVEVNINPLNKVCDKWQEAPWDPEAQMMSGIRPPVPPNPHVDWNCPGLRTAVTIQGTLNDRRDVDQGWTAEVAVPFASLRQFAGALTCPPQTGDCWRIMLCREYRPYPFNPSDQYQAQFWTWPVLGGGTTHLPHRWGYAVFQGKSPCDPMLSAAPPFAWQAWWPRAWGTRPDPEELTDSLARLGFQALILPVSAATAKEPAIDCKYIQAVLEKAHQRGLLLFTAVDLLTMPPDGGPLADRVQRLKPRDAGLRGVNLNDAAWLCPDQGLAESQKAFLADFLRQCPVTGIAVPNLGYRNGYACYCAESIRRRAAFAAAHTNFTEKEIMVKFAAEALTAWTAELRSVVQAANPKAQVLVWAPLACDLAIPAPAALAEYADQALDFGDRLAADYCAYTVAPTGDSLWSAEKISEITRQLETRAKPAAAPRFMPLVEWDRGGPKDAGRLRQERRAIGLAGAKRCVLATRGIDVKELEKFLATAQ